jgi:hypothetical protein
MALAGAAMWLSRQERLWAERLDRMDAHLARRSLVPATTTDPDNRLTETTEGRP